ncbi:MAG TPA: hypothetical protein VLZ84_12285 [Asticcacaulis sp.]|nr:hypothetical protein [Asticcacaulis sp.]
MFKQKLMKYRRPLAIIASLGLHALLISALTISSASEFADKTVEGDGRSDVQGVEIDLLGLHDSAAAMAQAYEPPAQPQNSPLDAFMQMTDPAPTLTETSVEKSPAAQSITEALGENPFTPQDEPAGAPKSSIEAHIKTQSSDHQTPNDLWKAIAPCWNRIADKNALPVTLEVSFSALGNLSKPPVIKREPFIEVTDRMLRSESQAISALSQCSPYLMAFGQTGVQVHFPGKR